MKRTMSNIIRNILFATVVTGLLAACVKTDEEITDTSSLFYHATDSTLTIGGDDSETTLHVDADCSWQFATTANWLNVSPQSGSGSMDVRVIADGPNPSWTAQREAELVLTSQDGIAKRIIVRQNPCTKHVLEVSPKTLSFESVNAASIALKVECNSSWTIENNPDWLTLSAVTGNGNSQVNVTCEDNTQTTERTGIIVFVAFGGELREEVSVTQKAFAPMLAVLPKSLSLAANETDPGAFFVSSNVEWNISSADWVKLSQNAGSGNAQVNVSCDYNYATVPRSCILTVQTNSGLVCNVELTQEGAKLPVLTKPEVQTIEETYAAFSCVVTESMFEVTECGIYVSTTDNPAVTGKKWKMDNAAMSYNMTVTGLDKKRVYYVCAYAISPVGPAYSEVVTFTTLSIPKEGDNDKPNY